MLKYLRQRAIKSLVYCPWPLSSPVAGPKLRLARAEIRAAIALYFNSFRYFSAEISAKYRKKAFLSISRSIG